MRGLFRVERNLAASREEEKKKRRICVSVYIHMEGG